MHIDLFMYFFIWVYM